MPVRVIATWMHHHNMTQCMTNVTHLRPRVHLAALARLDEEQLGLARQAGALVSGEGFPHLPLVTIASRDQCPALSLASVSPTLCAG